MINKALFFNKNRRIPVFFFASSEKKPFKRACDGAYCPLRHDAYCPILNCPIKAEIRAVNSQSDLRILL